MLREQHPGFLTPGMALAVALDTEQCKLKYRHTDPVWLELDSKQQDMETMAILLEKECNDRKSNG